jgi:hypothetical protein
VRYEVTLDIDDPEAEGFVHLTPSKAATVAEELKSVTDPRRHLVTVIGVISLADAIHKEFALDLDTTTRKPPMLRGKRRVRGGYTPKVESKIRELGLWGRRVRARIEIERDPLLSTSTIRPPRFRLLDVEEAVT